MTRYELKRSQPPPTMPNLASTGAFKQASTEHFSVVSIYGAEFHSRFHQIFRFLGQLLSSDHRSITSFLGSWGRGARHSQVHGRTFISFLLGKPVADSIFRQTSFCYVGKRSNTNSSSILLPYSPLLYVRLIPFFEVLGYYPEASISKSHFPISSSSRVEFPIPSLIVYLVVFRVCLLESLDLWAFAAIYRKVLSSELLRNVFPHLCAKRQSSRSII